MLFSESPLGDVKRNLPSQTEVKHARKQATFSNQSNVLASVSGGPVDILINEPTHCTKNLLMFFGVMSRPDDKL